MLTEGEDRITSDRRVSAAMKTVGREDIFTLTITDITLSDEGTYRCETTNRNPDKEDVEVTITGRNLGI